MLAKRRRAEAMEAGRRIGVTYEVLDNHDGELLPTVDVRQQIIRRIRQWNADIVLAPRPNDYHPDHRYTGVLVQDAAYMVVVPNVCPDTPPLRNNPVFLYFEDGFQRPNPFRPDVSVVDRRCLRQKDQTRSTLTFRRYMSGCHGWTTCSIRYRKITPSGASGSHRTASPPIGPAVRKALEKWYGPDKAARVKVAESFEVCEYGRQPSDDDLRRLFPMLGK